MSLSKVQKVLPWWLLVTSFIFLAVHLYFLFAVKDAHPVDFDNYTASAELWTHLFSLFALIESPRLLKEQIVITVSVSVLYHTIRNYFPDVEYENYRRLDLGMSVGLISVVLLRFLSNVEYAPIVLFATLSAAFEWGNVVSSILVSIISVGVVAIPMLGYLVRHPLNVLLFIISLGERDTDGDMPIEYTRTERHWLLLSLAFQVGGVVAFFTGDELEEWTHCLWHYLSFSALWALSRVINLKDARDPSCVWWRKKRRRRRRRDGRRLSREEYVLLDSDERWQRRPEGTGAPLKL